MGKEGRKKRMLFNFVSGLDFPSTSICLFIYCPKPAFKAREKNVKISYKGGNSRTCAPAMLELVRLGEGEMEENSIYAERGIEWGKKGGVL